MDRLVKVVRDGEGGDSTAVILWVALLLSSYIPTVMRAITVGWLGSKGKVSNLKIEHDQQYNSENTEESIWQANALTGIPSYIMSMIEQIFCLWWGRSTVGTFCIQQERHKCKRILGPFGRWFVSSRTLVNPLLSFWHALGVNIIYQGERIVQISIEN